MIFRTLFLSIRCPDQKHLHKITFLHPLKYMIRPFHEKWIIYYVILLMQFLKPGRKLEVGKPTFLAPVHLPGSQRERRKGESDSFSIKSTQFLSKKKKKKIKK